MSTQTITRSTVCKLGHVVRIIQGEEFAEHKVNFDKTVPDDHILETLLAIDPAYHQHERCIGDAERFSTTITIIRAKTRTTVRVNFDHFC